MRGLDSDWYADAMALDDVGKAENPRASRPLAAGEVRVQVRAAGLNFYDVAGALGLARFEDGLGAEGAGVVVETGPEVTRFSVGDRVFGGFPSAFAPLTIADERMVVSMPSEWKFEQAASVPAVFMTAYYGLRDLAGLKAGERVLIHAAAGGVGMAAVQLARLWGAEVYATASPAKWPTLRAMGIDDDHIANSRTLDFRDTFHTHTHHHGMDVILGSLAGDHVDASLDLLAPTGRYIEMGKTDIREPGPIHAAYPGRTYQAFDLKEAGPHRTQEMLTDITEHLTQHHLTLLPRTDWHLADLPSALRHMSQGRHTGKNVIHIPTPYNPEGTTLITGGTGTLATLLARHLTTQHHTRHLHLISRQGPHHPNADTLRKELLDLGAETVTLTACDVTDSDAIATTLAAIPPSRPLTAVIHTAGTLNDATLTTLTPDQLHTVLATKADAAHHLHHHTRHHNLAAFVLYSSVAGHLGSPGQANYAAANTFLDALATHRHTHHQPATSLAWGLWAQASGMTAHLNDQDLARMNRTAIQPLTNTTALQLFDTHNQASRPVQLAAQLNYEYIPAQAVFSRLATVRRTAETTQQGPALTDQLAQLTPAEQREHLLTLIRRQTAQILTLDDPTTIDPGRGFLDQGLDSLTAVELRNRLSTATSIRLPATTIFDHPTPHALTDHLLTQLAPDTANTAQQEQVQGPAGEADIRRALMGVPLSRLREAGLMKPLLVLLGLEDFETEDSADSTASVADEDAIDGMAVEDLLQIALGTDS